MAERGGHGVNSNALVSIATVCVHFSVITKVIGAVCALIGTCGSVTIITSHLDGFGVASGELVIICIANEFTRGGPALAGLWCAGTGI